MISSTTLSALSSLAWASLSPLNANWHVVQLDPAPAPAPKPVTRPREPPEPAQTAVTCQSPRMMIHQRASGGADVRASTSDVRPPATRPAVKWSVKFSRHLSHFSEMRNSDGVGCCGCWSAMMQFVSLRALGLGADSDVGIVRQSPSAQHAGTGFIPVPNRYKSLLIGHQTAQLEPFASSHGPGARRAAGLCAGEAAGQRQFAVRVQGRRQARKMQAYLWWQWDESQLMLMMIAL